MSLPWIQLLEFIFAVATVIGFSLHSIPRSAAWLGCSLFLGADIWRSLRVGEISTFYSFTVSREDSPVVFTGIIVFQSLFMLFCFLVSLFSL
jgi:hypothetical protein